MFQPPLLIWLLLAASLMTSSDADILGVGKPEDIKYEFACVGDEFDTCSEPKLTEKAVGDNSIFTCDDDGLYHESDNLLDRSKPEIIRHASPTVKLSCVTKCDKYYRRVARGRCAGDSECTELVGDTKEGLRCKDKTRTLVVNGIAVKSFAKCDPVKGWTDTNKNEDIANFEKGGQFSIHYYCHENCDVSMVRNLCGTAPGCVQFLFDASDDSITCQQVANGPPARLILFDQSKNYYRYEKLKCSNLGWTDETGKKELINFVKTPFAKINAKCHTYCDMSMIVNTCAGSENCKDAEPKFKPDHTKLTCPDNYFLKIDDVAYKELECSAAGMGEKGKPLLINFDKNPLQKLRAKCLPYCHNSMVEDVCPECTAKPEYKAGKLTCSPETDRELIIGDKVYNDVTCSAKGWKSTNTSKMLVDNKAKFDKVKAHCRKSTAKTSTPAPTTTTPPPPPPSTNCTVSVGSSEARKADEKEGGSSSMLIGGVVGGIVGLAAGVGIGMFICKKKKNRAGPASNNMSKTTKGKKKSKEELPGDAEVTVMMPGHQMSQMTTGNLTAAIVASNPPPSIPSSSMGEPK